jgi:hypothetical protein
MNTKKSEKRPKAEKLIVDLLMRLSITALIGYALALIFTSSLHIKSRVTHGLLN